MAGNQPIDVLLATYNGANYLEPFLDSLAKQKDVDIHLIVSDDGSTDSTLEIVHRFKRSFPRVTVLEGPKKGPMSNFFFLLRSSQADYIALADQDDIWGENHLRDSIRRITTIDIPALTFSSVEQFDESSGSRIKWPQGTSQPLFPGILFENIGRGCTFVLNGQARELINIKEPRNAIMHDWWILLLVLNFGEVRFSPTSEIQYRIHDNNFVGVNNKRFLQFMRTLLSGQWLPIAQSLELAKFAVGGLERSSTYDLDSFLINLQGGLRQRVKLAIKRGVKYRQNPYDDIKMRFGLILLPLLHRKRRNRDVMRT